MIECQRRDNKRWPNTPSVRGALPRTAILLCELQIMHWLVSSTHVAECTMKIKETPSKTSGIDDDQKDNLIFSPFCKASLQMFRPSSVSAWGAVRTVPKRTTTLVRQQHLWRPRPSVPRCVRRCLELPPFPYSRLSQRILYLISRAWYLKEIVVALLSRPTPTAQRQAKWDRHGRRPPHQQAPKTGDWYRPTSVLRQNVAQTAANGQANRRGIASSSHRGIVGTT